MIKYIDLLCKVFGDKAGQVRGYPGHPELELALLRLYKVTQDPEHLKLAHFFLNERGNPQGVNGQSYYTVEAKRRGETQLPRHLPFTEPLKYYQAHKPIVEQETVEGHAVRCMYLLTAVADLCLLEPQAQERFLPALKTLWANMTRRKMYLTGGIGAIAQWEGFGEDYFLPQSTDEGGCYSETCAAIGVMMLAERMLQVFHPERGESVHQLISDHAD